MDISPDMTDPVEKRPGRTAKLLKALESAFGVHFDKESADRIKDVARWIRDIDDEIDNSNTTFAKRDERHELLDKWLGKEWLEKHYELLAPCVTDEQRQIIRRWINLTRFIHSTDST